MAGILTCVVSGLTSAGCPAPLSGVECEHLLDRYVELLVASDRPDVSGPELQALKSAAREKAHSDPAFQSCRVQVSRRAFECAMRAPNVDGMEQCLL